MNDEIKAEWVARLRSGAYLQGHHALRQRDEKGEVYCCLGVLCEIAEERGIITGRWGPAFHGGGTTCYTYFVAGTSATNYQDAANGILPETVMTWAGLSGIDPVIEGRATLSGLNDGGTLFPEIADLIEVHL